MVKIKKPCRACPTKKCGNCPVLIEEAALKSAENFGAPEKLWIPDPDTGEHVYIDMKNPSAEALVVLEKIYALQKEQDLKNLYPKYNCPKCGDWFHMPYKDCKCKKDLV